MNPKPPQKPRWPDLATDLRQADPLIWLCALMITIALLARYLFN